MNTGIRPASPAYDAPTEGAWRAVSGRDRRFDGRFVYVALTTNIYCRPSCPARLPQRRHVHIGPTAAEAERQGYMACRRCHPGTDDLAPAERSIERALAFIEDHIELPVTLVTLSRASGLSPNHLQRVFTRFVGLSPRTFRDFRRLVRLKELLRSCVPVSRAGYDAGYGSARALYETAGRGLGMTPAMYQRGGDGARIRYALGETPLGGVLVASTQAGVCTLIFGARRDARRDGDAADSRVHDLAREFPRATRSREGRMPSVWLDALRCAQREDPLLLRLPLATRRDVFRARVWQRTLAIRSG
jgi:AraC family transcriptional regulator, regulatory protein of adaptative response / methylated-DNA-[protein]-cysteine methyltransferase